MKAKHNKKRNTAFLYETLVRELTKASVKDDRKRKHKLVKVIRHAFRKGTALAEDLAHYKTLLETHDVQERLAERLIEETKTARASLSAKQLFNEQSQLIAVMNREFGQDIFKTFVPNYKALASVYQIFNKDIPVKKRVFLEESIRSQMIKDTPPLEQKSLEPISRLAYKTFVNRFNEEYGNGLLQEQKELLSKFVVSFTDNGLGLKVYLNEELGRLKEAVRTAMETDEIKSDKDMTTKAKRVLSMLESFAQTPADKPMVETVLKIQNLVDEVNRNDDQD